MKTNKLHNIKSTGFNTPKAYFESLDEKILNKLHHKNTLDGINTTGFNTPNHYFDTLEDVISHKIDNKKTPKVISLFNRKSIIYAASIAAAILLLFNLSVFNDTPSFDTLNTETVENYILNENITSYEIAALFTEEQLNEDIFVEYNFNENNIEEYLLDDTDIESLMIE